MSKATTHQFETEITQLLDLMIHSLYSKKEIFLRELISNASDAIDKRRFEALTDSKLLPDESEMRVRISLDKDKNTITIADTGLGMSQDEVIENIGTIARSGTKKFMQALESAKDQKNDDVNLIGQFGVGFYSAFVVADKVVLTTRKAGDAADQAIQWTSDGSGGYTLAQVAKDTRGTEVVLHVKDDSKDFVNNWRLRSIIKKYSDHITFPIMMLGEVAPPAEDSDEPALNRK